MHCVDDVEQENPQYVLPISFPGGETIEAGINVRPYALECLRSANEFYQVIVFTASHQSYADVVLDFLDPHHELIQYRLYRDSCVQTEDGVYVKDLRIIANRDLKDLVIVDNAVYSFGFQLDNGIPIIPYYEDAKDEELLHLVYYINCLASFEDVREQNRKAFQLRELDSSQLDAYLEQSVEEGGHEGTYSEDEEDYQQYEEEEEEEGEGGHKEEETKEGRYGHLGQITEEEEEEGFGLRQGSYM